ncbi:hypothetical protein BC629DRAFT_46783 [Irpex lacteus]|nr:hypothetical protein BC629DRAFT_46783 [Irpex lacteus]
MLILHTICERSWDLQRGHVLPERSVSMAPQFLLGFDMHSQSTRLGMTTTRVVPVTLPFSRFEACRMLPDVSGQYRSVPGQSLRGDCGLILKLEASFAFNLGICRVSIINDRPCQSSKLHGFCAGGQCGSPFPPSSHPIYFQAMKAAAESTLGIAQYMSQCSSAV